MNDDDASADRSNEYDRMMTADTGGVRESERCGEYRRLLVWQSRRERVARCDARGPRWHERAAIVCGGTPESRARAESGR
eukprot:2521486-Prymnesium_polylepis.1